MRRVSELEGALMELRDRLINVEDGVLLVDLTNHLVTFNKTIEKQNQSLYYLNIFIYFYT